MFEKSKSWAIAEESESFGEFSLYPLKEIMGNTAITFGESFLKNETERALYRKIRKEVDFISSGDSLSFIGKLLYRLLKRVEKNSAVTVNKNSSKSTSQTRLLQVSIKEGLGKSLMELIHKEPLPLIHAHPLSALIADAAGYSLNYCLVSNAAVNRAWVSDNPKNSKIVYITTSAKPIPLLRAFGVPDERIYFTGIPFPTSLLGDENLPILKHDVGQRLHYLDPQNLFWPLHGRNVRYFLSEENAAFKKDRNLTLTYVARPGGENLADINQLIAGFKAKIRLGEIRLVIAAGTNTQTVQSLENTLRTFGLSPEEVPIITGKTFGLYFRAFTEVLRTTDILWTYPNELVFYCGLSMPVIVTGAKDYTEEQNRRWLIDSQFGIADGETGKASEWLLSLVQSGKLAEMAWGAFLNFRKYGTYKILEILAMGTMMRESSPLKR